MGIRCHNPMQTVKKTILKPVMFTTYVVTGTYTAGRVALSRIELTEGQFVSAINFYNFATVAGNITVGIYAEGATGTPANGAVIIQSASVAHAGGNAFQSIPVTQTWLAPGYYYIAFEASDATATVGKLPQNGFFTGSGYYYDRGGGYGALTTPCPAVTGASANMPAMVLVSP